jgi:threonine aldolase
MGEFNRRSFMATGAAVPLASAFGISRSAATPTQGGAASDIERLRGVVKFTGDGQSLTPFEYSHVLQEILSKREIDADYYSRGGSVAALEERMAGILGKERAVFLPTGTLANSLAVRIQARGRSRAIVQDDSHLYNDSGDCAQVLSNLNLVPLAHDAGTFTLRDVERVIDRAASGRVHTGIGSIVIESPIRRRRGELFDYDEMQRICRFARDNDIATHLDGARLFMASGYTGITPAEYASHFDTVYVSMWKYFNASSGAILAGPRDLLDDLYHDRRMFGGALPGAWPLTAVALHFIEGFEERFAAGVTASKLLIEKLDELPGMRVEGIPNGSNIFKLHVEGVDLTSFHAAMAERDVRLPGPASGWSGFFLNVNETLARRPVEETAQAFREALGA